MSSAPTLTPSTKRPRDTEDDVTDVIRSVKKLKLGDENPTPSLDTDTKADIDNKDTSDEMSDENLGDDEGRGEDGFHLTWLEAAAICNESDWGSSAQMTFSSSSTDEAGSPESTMSQAPMPTFSFDKEYPDPEECFLDSDVSAWQEEQEQELDDDEEADLDFYKEEVELTRTEQLKKLRKIRSIQESPRWDSARDGSRLLPEAINCILNFFREPKYVSPAECEQYCLKAYLRERSIPSEVQGRPLNVLACPSECQFPNSYMVEVIDTTIANPALMTLFYINPEKLDEAQLAKAKEAYGNFVPQYTYIGCMQHLEDLFVWRIVSPAGRPFAADAYRIGLRANQDKYVSIVKHFVDFVCEPLRGGGGGGNRLGNGNDWPMVPHNPLLNKHNIIIREDWSGIACVLLWAVPSVATLPFGASLSGLLTLTGNPHDQGDAKNDRSYTHYPSMFKNYSREAAELERLCMYYLREKHSALASDPRPWHSLFAAMAQGVATAAHSDKLKDEVYGMQVDELKWDWFHFEMNPDVPDESAAESGHGQEDGDADMDMDMD